MIREYREGDIEKGLLDTYIDGFKYHENGRSDVFKYISREDSLNTLKEMIEDETMYVYLIDDEVVSYISFFVKEKRSRVFYINQLVVKEGIRGKGIGKKMLLYVEDLARNLKCDRIEFNCWAFNRKAIEIYEHLGYTEQRVHFEKVL